MVTTEYVPVHNRFASLDGVLRRASSGRPRTVVVETHPRRDSVSNLSAWPMDALPSRGIDTFAYNNRYANSAAGIDVSTLWEPLALDVAAAVQEMRERGYERVVLYGTSAGGPLVAFYQAVAEQGNALFEPERALSGFVGYTTPDGAELRLPRADGVVLQNATSGPASSFLMRLDGSVVDERDVVRDPALDMFAPENGFDPLTGTGHYDADFLTRYTRAQSERMNRLVRTAQELLDRMRRTGRPYLDDAFLVIPGVRAFPAHVDLTLADRTRGTWPTTEGPDRVVRSTRAVVPDASADNRRRMPGTAVHTLTSFLSYRAVLCEPATYDPFATEVGDSGVHDWSSNTSTTRNVARVSVPLLITVGTSDLEVHLPVGELIHNAATSRDKELVIVDRADHAMTRPAPPGGPDPARAAHLDAVAAWVEDRFGR